jgi:Domain of unknown function (DUF4136)
VLACAGCRTPSGTPHATLDPAVDFTAYRTFVVLPPATKPGLNAATAKAVVEAAERGARDALKHAGYTDADRESADLVLYLHGKALAPVAVKDWGYEPSYHTFGISSAEASKMSKTHIFVEAYDNKTKRQIWMDWVICTCSQVVPSRIEGEIHHILEGFPARAGVNTVSLAEYSPNLHP